MPSRKKELIEQYKQMRPEMGVLLIRCLREEAVFLAPCPGFTIRRNRILFQLNMGSHPNRRLQQLWQQYGQEGFEMLELDTLAYREGDNYRDSYVDELRELAEAHLASYPGAVII